MKVNEKIKKCIAFLQYKMDDDTFKYAGTCFFVFRETNGSQNTYVITAKHVLDEVRKKTALLELFVRVNLKNGLTKPKKTEIDRWIKHNDKNVDLAMHDFSFEDDYDHLFYPETSFLTDQLVTQYEIDSGEEVIISGLFKHHPGSVKNSPIVRIGNISLMPPENIQLGDHSREAYLVESRSISGLSGSPVFVNLGDVRKFGNQVKHAQGEHLPILLGVVYGHFDTRKGEIDTILDSSEEQKQINVGIAIVTPVKKLVELLNQKKE